MPQIVAAVGLELADLFPRNIGAGSGPTRLRLPASQALEILSRETLLIYVVAHDMAERRQITPDDHARLRLAVQRVHAIVEAAR